MSRAEQDPARGKAPATLPMLHVVVFCCAILTRTRPKILWNQPKTPSRHCDFALSFRVFTLSFRVFTLFPSPETAKIRGKKPKTAKIACHDLMLFVVV
jgi:hypothetical protein